MIENPDTRQIPLSTGGLSRGIENIAEFPQRVLEASDQFFRAMTQGGLEASNTYRQSRLGGKLANSADQADDLLFRGDMTGDGKGIVSNFFGAGAQALDGFRNSQYAIVRWPAKFTIPFLKTGTNVVKTGAEYTPLFGAINMIGNTDKTAQVAKMAIGGMVTYVGANWAMQDRLSFGPPTNPTRKKAYDSAHIQPYSIKFGDNWYSYTKMHPAIAFPLASVAAVSEAVKEGRIDEDTGERVMNGVANTWKFIADASWAKNVGDFVSMVNGSGGTFAKLASNYPTQLIPARALLSWVNGIVDQYQRDPNTDDGFGVGLMQQIMAQVPGLSQNVPPKLDMYEQPMERQHQLFNAISPARVSTEDPQGRQVYDAVTEKALMTRDLNDTKKQMMKDLDPSGGQMTQGGATASLGNLPPGVRQVGDKLMYLQDGEVKTLKIADYEKAKMDAQYGLLVDRLTRAKDYTSLNALNQQYLGILRDRQSKLDPFFDQAESIQLQNKIEDLQYKINKPIRTGRKLKPIKFKVPKAKRPKTVKTPRPKVYKMKVTKLGKVKVFA